MNSARLKTVDGIKLKSITDKIRELNEAGKLFIRNHHIEKERIYRGITLEHVDRVLSTGRVTEVRESDSSVLWQGRDADGRLLELNCTLKDEEGDVTVVVQEVRVVVVGTAYDPSESDDDALKAKWLKEHPEYEDAGKRKGVQKKLIITRV